MAGMWMVRGDGGRLYEDFRERKVAAIGWTELGTATKGMSRKDLAAMFREAAPNLGQGAIVAGASQVWRFINEIAIGDTVVTYSPSNRTYLIGVVTGESTHKPDWAADDMVLARAVDWRHEVERDVLSQPTRNSLGSTLTVFQVPPNAAKELTAVATGKPAPAVAPLELVLDDEQSDPFDGIEAAAAERIKDRISALDWAEMQELVAGILRAMGYKTQVSPAGADRGKDIVASPDGFGFENPRIVVEVKHRQEKMGSQEVRSFINGRHKDDRGLYVSTGGFSREAYYEADRAPIPTTLWTLDQLVRALMDHYDSTDTETKRLVPLKRMYWPA